MDPADQWCRNFFCHVYCMRMMTSLYSIERFSLTSISQFGCLEATCTQTQTHTHTQEQTLKIRYSYSENTFKNCHCSGVLKVIQFTTWKTSTVTFSTAEGVGKTERFRRSKSKEKMHQGYKIHSEWGTFKASTLVEKDETLCKIGNTTGNSFTSVSQEILIFASQSPTWKKYSFLNSIVIWGKLNSANIITCHM